MNKSNTMNKIKNNMRDVVRVAASTYAFVAFAVMSASGSTAPQVSNVSITQHAVTHLVTVTYEIDKPAVVTMDVTTNGVSIGGENLWYQAGDVNRLVKDAAGTKTITWQPDKAWPGKFTDPGVEVRAVVTAWATNAPPDYMVVDLAAKSNVTYYACAEAVPYGVTNDLYKTTSLVMRKIPAGQVVWNMGSAGSAHKILISNDYYLGIYEVTRGQASAAGINTYTTTLTLPHASMQFNNIRGQTSWPNNPAQGNYSDGYLGTLRTRTGVRFDLPTRAQWEFACRAGSGYTLYASKSSPTGQNAANTSSDTYCNSISWNKNNSGSTAKPVGEKIPNLWGLYDMIGNVWEMVLDWYGGTITWDDSGVTTDLPGAPSGTNSQRYICGGTGVGSYAVAVPTTLSQAGQACNQGLATTGWRLWAPCEAK